MDHYIDMRLLPDPEFRPTVLMNALFAKLHRALVDRRSRNIGISFPDVQTDVPALGGRLRLHGSKSDLDGLMSTEWLKGMRDHLDHCEPTPVPDTARYRSVRRVQAKSSPERLRRRAMKRKGLSREQAEERIPDGSGRRLALPYITINSRSTSQQFRLFIEHGPMTDIAKSGAFSCYGLSAEATVPWF